MKFKFENLTVWNIAMDLADSIQTVIKTYPLDERFNLIDQTLRSVDSIALNIAEGSIGQTHAEQRRFVGYSIRSLAEFVTCLLKAKRRKYIDDLVFSSYYEQSYKLMNMLIAFRRSIK